MLNKIHDLKKKNILFNEKVLMIVSYCFIPLKAVTTTNEEGVNKSVVATTEKEIK
jgi:hypothetical protein